MKILLTFDVEKFELSNEQKFEISRQGLFPLLELLSNHNIKATFFTTAEFTKKHPQLIKSLSKEGHEVACHGYSLSDNPQDISRIELAKKEIEKIIKADVKGFRAHRFNFKRVDELAKFGLLYDSSIHPTYAPGRYFNLHKKRKIHKIGEVIEIPPSVLPLPLLRLPIFWLAFKNFPPVYSRVFTKLNSLFSDYLMLTFHPWEFSDLKNIRVPSYIKRKHGKKLLEMLENYILFVKKRHSLHSFSTISNYLKLS